MALDIRSLSAGYGDRWVLDNLAVSVRDRECVCVVGSNAAGKTTLLRTISRQVPRTKGQIVFDDIDLVPLRANQVPYHRIAHVPEGRQIFPGLTVHENLALGAYASSGKERSDSMLTDRFEFVHSLFPRLSERSKQLVGTMSGGEQQMVAIGRALMLGPRLLMLDEPTHGLSPALVEEIYEKIIQVRAAGISILLVEQNVAKAFAVSDRAYVLEKGRIALEGPIDEVRNLESVRTAYLGV